MTRTSLLASLVLPLLLAACSDSTMESPAAATQAVSPPALVDGTIQLLTFYDLRAYAEGVPCNDKSPVPLAAAAKTREELLGQGDSVTLAVIGDTTVDSGMPLRGRATRRAGRARALVIMDAMTAAGVELWVPGHADIDLFGIDVLLAEAKTRGLTVLLSNAELSGDEQLTPYVVVQDHNLRLALLGALEPQAGDGGSLAHDGLRLIKPKRRLKQVADGIMQRGEADMLAVLSAMPNKSNHRVAEIGSVHFIIGAAEGGLAADFVVRRTGAALMAHKHSGRELAQTTFRVVDGDWDLADMSPLWTLPRELADEEANLQRWEQQYGTRDPEHLARLITPDRPSEFLDKYSLHHENIAFLKEYADYAGSMLAHHAVPMEAVGDDDPIVRILAGQGPAMTAAVAELATEPPAFEGDARIAQPGDCQSCHSAQYDFWSATPHARSYEVLGSAGRQLDASCLSCHAAGFGQSGSGYKDPRLDGPYGGVTCWSCHAVSSLHYETRMGVVEPENAPIRHREGMLAACSSCHGARRSTGFELESAMDAVACPPMQPQDPALVAAYRKALSAFERNRLSESFTARHLYQEGRALIGLGRHEEGLALIREYAMGLRGGTSRTVEIANYLDRKGDSRGALELLRLHVKNHPGDPDAHTAYAYILVHALDADVRDPALAASHMDVVAPFDPNGSMDANELPFRKLQVEALFGAQRPREARRLLKYLLGNFRENPSLQELAEQYAID